MLEIDIAGLVAPDFLAVAARKERRAPRGAVPPGEGVCENSHDAAPLPRLAREASAACVEAAGAARSRSARPARPCRRRVMPSSAARPPASSSTAPTGSPAGTGSSDKGTALASIRAIVPSARMKIMSSGISVFFIQNDAGTRRVVGEDHAAVGGQRLAVHQPLRLLRLGARDLDREAMRLARGGGDRQRHLVEPGGRALERDRAVAGVGWHAASASSRSQQQRGDQRGSAERAPRPRSGPCCPPRSAPRAVCPGSRSAIPAWRTVSMCTKISSARPRPHPARTRKP